MDCGAIEVLRSPLRYRPVLLIRLDHRVICKGNKAAAAILALMERWTAAKIQLWQNQHESMSWPPPEDLWITGNSLDFITDYLGGAMTVKTLREGIKLLVSEGLMETRQVGGYERITDYRLCVATCNAVLAKITASDLAKYISSDRAAHLMGDTLPPPNLGPAFQQENLPDGDIPRVSGQEVKLPHGVSGHLVVLPLACGKNDLFNLAKRPDDLYTKYPFPYPHISTRVGARKTRQEGECPHLQTVTSSPAKPEGIGDEKTIPPAAKSFSGEKRTCGDDDQSSTAEPKSFSERKTTWGDRYIHPAAKMTAYYQAGAAGQTPTTGTRKFGVLQREKMSGLIAIGDEAWDLVAIEGDRVEFTPLAIAGAREIMPKEAPESRVRAHLINKAKEGSRTELRNLIESGRTALAAQSAAATAAQPVAAVAAPEPDLSTPEAYARQSRQRLMGDEPDGNLVDVDHLLATLYAARETGIALRARRIAILGNVRDAGMDVVAIENRILNDLAGGKVDPAVAIAILQSPLKAENLAGKLLRLAETGSSPAESAYSLLVSSAVPPQPASGKPLESFAQAAGLFDDLGEFDFTRAIAQARAEFERLGLRSEAAQESTAMELSGVSRWMEGNAAQLELLCSKLRSIPSGAMDAG